MAAISLIQFYRIRMGLSQQDLARETGISQPAISQYENGLSAPLAHLQLIFNVLSIYPGFSRTLTPEDLRRSLGEIA